jgi:HrpA-like RNA helicase
MRCYASVITKLKYAFSVALLYSNQAVDKHKQLRKKGETMKSMRVIPLIAGVLAIGASSAAMAGGLNVGVNIGIPAPVYVAPAPVYAPPPPPPPPVIYQPAPVVVAPAIVIGWHGDRYWDGRRYWGRDEWYRHHGGGYGHDRGHWDNGRHNGWH